MTDADKYFEVLTELIIDDEPFNIKDEVDVLELVCRVKENLFYPTRKKVSDVIIYLFTRKLIVIEESNFNNLIGTADLIINQLLKR